MKVPALYLATAAIFLAIDLIGLRFVIRPVFERHISHLFADPFRIAPAVVFYLGYVGGILWFVSIPALRSADPMAALINGALLGLFAYGTYELTNYVTLQDWSMSQVLIDMTWGGFVTGLAAWLGLAVVRAFS